MLLTIETDPPELSFLDYLCDHVSDFGEDSVLLLLVDQSREVQRVYKEKVISVLEYAQRSLQIIDTVRSRPLGLRAIEEYTKNHIKTY